MGGARLWSPAPVLDRGAGDQEIDCDIAGVWVRIEGLPPAVRRRLVSLLGPFVMPMRADAPNIRLQVRRQGRANWALYIDAAETPAACGASANMVRHIELQAISKALAISRTAAVFHGGALARDKSTVLLVGPSGAGKTTLTLGLMGRGWEPYTDDAAVVDMPSLALRAFPRCFHVTPGALARLAAAPKMEWFDGMVGYARPHVWAKAVRPPTAIVLVERDRQRQSAIIPVTQAEAAAVLLSQTISGAIPSASLAAVAVGMAARAQRCVRLNNNDLLESLTLIEDICPL